MHRSRRRALIHHGYGTAHWVAAAQPPIRGADGVLLGFESQLSPRNPREIQARDVTARRAGVLDAWQTDSQDMARATTVPWLRTDRIPQELIMKRDSSSPSLVVSDALNSPSATSGSRGRARRSGQRNAEAGIRPRDLQNAPSTNSSKMPPPGFT